mmetsp:Transcript_18901/g.43603  ORF Transcript_18901/g.43603 Transcript_18901/m.43603 type:complete len:110 (+) Transcript_18901:657-986(+)
MDRLFHRLVDVDGCINTWYRASSHHITSHRIIAYRLSVLEATEVAVTRLWARTMSVGRMQKSKSISWLANTPAVGDRKDLSCSMAMHPCSIRKLLRRATEEDWPLGTGL